MKTALLPPAVSLALAALCAVAALSPAAARAQSAYHPLLSGTAGSGASESFLVIDFNDPAGSPASDADYAFGFRYDGSATGQEMLAALSDPSSGVGLQVTEQQFSFGEEVLSFSYEGHTAVADDSAETYWAYYLSSGSQLAQDPSDWASSGVGVTGRALTDDSYDGWTFSTYSDSAVPVAPAVSAAPAPEMGSAWGMGVAALTGAAALLAGRRPRR